MIPIQSLHQFNLCVNSISASIRYIFHSRQFTSSFTEKFKPIFTTFLPLILKASA